MVAFPLKGLIFIFSCVFSDLLVLSDDISVFIYKPSSSASKGPAKMGCAITKLAPKMQTSVSLEKNNVVPHINGKRNFWLLV